MSSEQEALALRLTAAIVQAHVSNNSIGVEALPGLIKSVFDTLSKVGTEPETAERPEPAVPVKRSVFSDYLVCLEDGKKLKMLKRHLSASYNMTPQEYRERWELPADYPMVAPNYAEKRSALAKQIGLGRKPAAPEPVVVARPAPGRPGRKKAA